jgi:UDP-N-acetylglucosamine 2-epimerase (hydrolysing)
MSRLKKTILNKKKIVFITGTRAEYGKLKPIIKLCQSIKNFNTYIFVTGMHTLSKYGNTYTHVIRENKKLSTIYLSKRKNNSNYQDHILSETIISFSKFINKIKPHLIVIHGDRIEAFAAAISGSLNNFLVLHIEGGEVSGTIDEHMRHSISKLSHIHFVANNEAKKILIQMGEQKKKVFVTGSPDLDVMVSKDLPSIKEVKKRYRINYHNYSVGILHPVTTELHLVKRMAKSFCNILNKSKKNYVLIYPNNDPGNDIIIKEIKNKIKKNKKLIFIKSMRFEYFLTLLKNSNFIIGNSSAGIREAPFYGIPTIDLGNRQKHRSRQKSIKNFNFEEEKVLNYIKKLNFKFKKNNFFGKGSSVKIMNKILLSKDFWNTKIQKYFVKDNN